MKMKHLGTRPTAQNNHSPQNRPLVQTAPEFNAPLRQFYQAKEGVKVIYTCTASEWCVDDGAKHGLHDYPPTFGPDVTTTIDARARIHRSTLLCSENSIVIQQEDSGIICTQFAPKWCVVARRNTWNTSPLISRPNSQMIFDKPPHQFTAQ